MVGYINFYLTVSNSLLVGYIHFYLTVSNSFPSDRKQSLHKCEGADVFS